MFSIEKEDLKSLFNLIPLGLFLLVLTAYGGNIKYAAIHYFIVLVVVIVIILVNAIYHTFKRHDWEFDWFDFIFGFSVFLVISSIIKFFI